MREDSAVALMRCGRRARADWFPGGVACVVNCAELKGQFYIPVRVCWPEARETGHTQFLRLHYDPASR